MMKVTMLIATSMITPTNRRRTVYANISDHLGSPAGPLAGQQFSLRRVRRTWYCCARRVVWCRPTQGIAGWATRAAHPAIMLIYPVLLLDPDGTEVRVTVRCSSVR